MKQMWILPMAHTIPWLHYDEYLDRMNFPMWGSYLYLAPISAPLVLYFCKGRTLSGKGIGGPRMIEIRNVSLRLDGKSILNNISLILEPGKIYGLVGATEVAKTMLMKCICGFVHPTEGEIKTDGRSVGKDVDYLPNAGIIIETPGFIPYYSGSQNLRALPEYAERLRMIGYVRLLR